MKAYAKKPERESRTPDSNSGGPGQSPVEVILQHYKKHHTQPSTAEEERIAAKPEPAQRKRRDEENGSQEKPDTDSTLPKEEAISHTSENHTGMPDRLRSNIETLSGYSLKDVRVHYNSTQPTQLQALAYTQGTEIHIAPGQERYLPHEAWHVVQQKQGRVEPTRQLQGLPVNDNEQLEKEADVMGEQAVQMKAHWSPLAKEKNVIQYGKTNKLLRPKFTKQTQKAVPVTAGQHRRHIVMSSRMRAAIWAYHNASLEPSQQEARRTQLQTFIGSTGTLRTEMQTAANITHNYIQNLFPGDGGENSAIGLAVNDLFEIANRIESGELNDLKKVTDAVNKWVQKGIFGFAAAHKASLGQFILEYLQSIPEGTPLETVAKVMSDFAFTCSFDLPYQRTPGEDKFPSGFNAAKQGQLLSIAQNIEQIIREPADNSILLYGDNCLGLLKQL